MCIEYMGKLYLAREWFRDNHPVTQLLNKYIPSMVQSGFDVDSQFHYYFFTEGQTQVHEVDLKNLLSAYEVALLTSAEVMLGGECWMVTECSWSSDLGDTLDVAWYWSKMKPKNLKLFYKSKEEAEEYIDTLPESLVWLNTGMYSNDRKVRRIRAIPVISYLKKTSNPNTEVK